MVYSKGTRVKTPKGEGTVKACRMAPPDFEAADAYSVLLDSRANEPGYYGSLIDAKDVVAVEPTK